MKMVRRVVHVQETYDANYYIDAPDSVTDDQVYQWIEEAVNEDIIDPTGCGEYDRQTSITDTHTMSDGEGDQVPADYTLNEEGEMPWGEYRAVRRGRHRYDVALVVRTPNGNDQYLFGKEVKTMREAREIAALFNKETGVTV